ncbi:hypothetical protein Patl1_27096 [Pistacia atlantica]|uniref:Uncharacterized protein n=1 Tax=Pistacia atlantica TaxID=434234 RepID=A0ACC1B4J0_9ROSI|nr:hypothetical protein Patl1_27096 [Pistacia atlantica]
MVGCLGNLYESIEHLSEIYIQPNQNKSSFLNPKSPVYSTDMPLLLSDHELKTRNVYMCPYKHSNVAETPNVVCPHCERKMTTEVPYVNASSNPAGKSTTVAAEGGFVKAVITYMVMDNLELKPMSTISCITMLNRFHVKDVRSLEEKVVDFGVEEEEEDEETAADYPLVMEEDDPGWPEDADGWGFSLGQFSDEITIKNVKNDPVNDPVKCLTAAVSTTEKRSFLSKATWVPIAKPQTQ